MSAQNDDPDLVAQTSPSKKSDSDDRTSGYGSDKEKGIVRESHIFCSQVSADSDNRSSDDENGHTIYDHLGMLVKSALLSWTSSKVDVSQITELDEILDRVKECVEDRVDFVTSEARLMPQRLEYTNNYRLDYELTLHRATTTYMAHLGFFSPHGLLDFAEHCFERIPRYQKVSGQTQREKWKQALDSSAEFREVLFGEDPTLDEQRILELVTLCDGLLDREEKYGGRKGRSLEVDLADESGDQPPEEVRQFLRRLAQFLNVCAFICFSDCPVHKLLDKGYYEVSSLWKAGVEGREDSEFLSVTPSTSYGFTPESTSDLYLIAQYAAENILDAPRDSLGQEIAEFFTRFSEDLAPYVPFKMKPLTSFPKHAFP